VLAQGLVQAPQLEPPGGGQGGEQVLAAVLQNHGLGQGVSRHMRRLGAAIGRRGMGMPVTTW
jgi:hypothetical protein